MWKVPALSFQSCALPTIMCCMIDGVYTYTYDKVYVMSSICVQNVYYIYMYTYVYTCMWAQI